jgi:hypothetical protein
MRAGGFFAVASLDARRQRQQQRFSRARREIVEVERLKASFRLNLSGAVRRRMGRPAKDEGIRLKIATERNSLALNIKRGMKIATL